MAAWSLSGCKSPPEYRREADRVAYEVVEEMQRRATGEVEPFTIAQAEETLRDRLLIEQGLPHVGPESRGTDALAPIPHWPDTEYLDEGFRPYEPIVTVPEAEPLRLTLFEALQVAARNSRDYQSAKEEVYLTALELDLERDFFETQWDGVIGGGATADLEPGDDVVGVDVGATGSVLKRFRNGVTLTGRIGVDLVKLLTQGRDASLGVFGDASIAIPLLRGAGEHIVAEPLTQAERDALYAIYEFERFKSVFAVDVANDYLGVLQALDSAANAEENYRSLVFAARRARRFADAGELPEIDVDQALQRELRARTRWISARQRYASAVDDFKVTLGLPTDAWIELDRDELLRLRAQVEAKLADALRAAPPADAADAVEGGPPTDEPATALAADAPIVLEEPSAEDAGPYELPEPLAVSLALAHRYDLRVQVGEVYDAQRRVVVAANGLLPELTLLGTVSTGETRSLSSAFADDSTSLPLDRAVYDALFTLDLPFERTAERNFYRASLIALERAVRDTQELEDVVKLQVRSTLRDLQESREALRIQTQAVIVAQRRVQATDLFLQAGRAEIRDLLEAQEDLVDAQNSLTSALVDYRVAELGLQRDLGLLDVDERGLWNEFDPEEVLDVER